MSGSGATSRTMSVFQVAGPGARVRQRRPGRALSRTGILRNVPLAGGARQALHLLVEHSQPGDTFATGEVVHDCHFRDYMRPSIQDLPSGMSVSVLEHLEANEIHGIGETSLPPVMPAIGNAVYRACCVRITDLPITPEKVLRELRSGADARAVTWRTADPAACLVR